MTSTTRTLTIGVLALQGAFSEHVQLLRRAFEVLETAPATAAAEVSWRTLEVRTPPELAACDALIIPGGESTAIALVAQRSGLLEALRAFVK